MQTRPRPRPHACPRPPDRVKCIRDMITGSGGSGGGGNGDWGQVCGARATAAAAAGASSDMLSCVSWGQGVWVSYAAAEATAGAQHRSSKPSGATSTATAGTATTSTVTKCPRQATWSRPGRDPCRLNALPHPCPCGACPCACPSPRSRACPCPCPRPSPRPRACPCLALNRACRCPHAAPGPTRPKAGGTCTPGLASRRHHRLNPCPKERFCYGAGERGAGDDEQAGPIAGHGQNVLWQQQALGGGALEQVRAKLRGSDGQEQRGQ